MDGQATASASELSADPTAMPASAAASAAIRSTTSSASASRHRCGATPGGAHVGGVNSATTIRRVTAQSSDMHNPAAAETPSRNPLARSDLG
jgi:hypothetical protein